MEEDKRDKPAISYKQLTVGSVIVYLLRPEHNPTHPEIATSSAISVSYYIEG